MINSVLEILKPLDETNEFAIVGYHGNPQPVLWSFPIPEQPAAGDPGKP